MQLSVPGCIRLSVEGILCSLKVSKSTGATGIKNLRIGGLFGVTNDHFEELKSLLEVDKDKPLHANQPRFYQGGQMYLPFDDDRAIDIEACPRCQQLRQVYDCPAASCQGEHQATCRACTLCVARCVNCGCCIKERDYEETFSLDFLCMGCSEAVWLPGETGTSGVLTWVVLFSISKQHISYHFSFKAMFGKRYRYGRMIYLSRFYIP